MTSQGVNRLTAGLATGIFLILSLLLANLSSPQHSDTLLRRPSTFFTDPSGARALFLVVKQFFPAAEQWRRPFQFLPAPPAASTLIVAGPQRPLGEREAQDLERWIGEGGQLILLTANGWPMRRQRAGEDAESDDGSMDESSPGAAPTFLMRHEPALRWSKPEKKILTGHAGGDSITDEKLNLGWHAGFRQTGGARAIASAGNTLLAVEIPVGHGRIVAVADPAMASNGALRRSDNAVWLIGLITSWRAGPVLFDEYHHGFGQKRGTMELTLAFFSTPWGWCVLQLAAAGLLYIFIYRRRFGRIREPLAPARASPLELIEARAGVFHTAGAQRLAADLIVQHLCQELGRAHSKTADSSNIERELQTAMERNGAVANARGIQDLGGRVQRGERLSDREFIEFGQRAGEIIKGSKP
jgi:hypothetical protein